MTEIEGSGIFKTGMNEVLCVHRWSVWIPIEVDEKGQPLNSLCRDYVEGDIAWRNCSRCNTWHINRDPEPEVVIGHIR